MNILPLVFALVLMLALMTIERLEKVKNTALIQNQYQIYLNEEEGEELRLRQERLYDLYRPSLKRISFLYILNKEEREKNLEKAKQIRQLVIDLIKVVYQDKKFYKKIEEQRPNFVEELISAIEKTSEERPDKYIRRIQDLSRINLEDEELQEAFYHMLKGTIPREKLIKEQITQTKDPLWISKAYPSLFTFINNNNERISIQTSPREVLKVIFVDDAVVDSVIKKRQELSKIGKEASKDFQEEFIDKRKPGIADTLLDFSISQSDKRKYD